MYLCRDNIEFDQVLTRTVCKLLLTCQSADHFFFESSRVTEVCCGLCQVRARVNEALEPHVGIRTTHLPGMKQHTEALREEIIADNKPLSRINIITDDKDLLKVLGTSGVLMEAEEDAPEASCLESGSGRTHSARTHSTEKQ